MAKGRRFYRSNNGQQGETLAEKQEMNTDTFNKQKNRNADEQKNVNAAAGPDQAAGEKTGRKQGGRNGNFNRRPGSRPFRKFNGKPNDRNPENRGKSPAEDGRRKPRRQTSDRILVAYYSWSGVTAKAAQRIASVVKGNSYRILPVKAYSSIYALCVAKGGMEKATGARPELKGSLPDCSRYDKIAIGFPIWWFSCPMIIHSFLEKVNLAGKTVYPFCTSKSSGPKSSSADIQKTVPNAVVKECLDANKIEGMSDEEIKAWLEM